MKTKALATALAAIILFAACKKERDAASLNDKITSQWQIDKYYGGGVDSTVYFNYPFGGYKIDVKAGGQYTERYTYFGSPRVVNGSWSFPNGDQYFQQVDSSQTRVFTIISLESNYMKLKNPLKDQQYWLKPL